MDDERKCSKCKSRSSKFNFYKDITKIDGYRPKCIKCTKQYHYKNREKRNQRERTRRGNDVNYRLIINTRRRIHRALKGKSESSSTKDILGKDIVTYKHWIEFQMTPEMNWSNNEIDHVKPICLFNVSDNEEIKPAFKWKKTQSLLREVHSQKGVKFNFLDYQLQFIKAYQFLNLYEKGFNQNFH